MLYTESISRDLYRNQFNRAQAPITPAIYFDEQAQPTPIAFSKTSTLLENLFGAQYGNNYYPQEMLKFVQEFSDQLEPTDQFYFKALRNLDPEDRNLHNSYANFLHQRRTNAEYESAHLQLIEGQIVPTESFWQDLDQNGTDLALITLFDNYENHFSPSRVAAAKLPAKTRKNLQAYIFSYDERGSNLSASEIINETLTDEGALQESFYQQEIIGTPPAERLAKDFPDQLAEHFNQVELNYLKLPDSYRNIMVMAHTESEQSNLPYDQLVQQCVDKNGPTDELFQLAFSQGRYDLLSWQHLRPASELPFSKNQTYVLQKYREIVNDNADRGLDLGKEYAKAISLVDIKDLTFEQIDSIVGIVNRVTNSNAVELRRAGANFLQEIVNSQDASAKLDQIEQVFLHNNLPYAGKVFRSFQVLYPAEETFDAEFYRATHRGVLENLPNTGIISKESVLFADLIKASIGSNNRSMKNYIKNLRQGQELSERILQQTNTYEDLSQDEKATLDTYLNHLETLSNNTEHGRQNLNSYTRSGDSVQDLRELSQHFSTTERYQLPDRVVRSFCYMLGIRSLDDLENYMHIATTAADARGRERYNANDFTLAEGDLVKAIDANYLGNILQNGSICKEFLNGEATSDATPLDTDITRLGAECTGNIDQAIDWKNANATFVPMSINLVIKNSELIQTDGKKYDPSKLELLNNGGSDCGIRTGFPSSNIDFIVYDHDARDYSLPSSNSLSFVFAEIAKNGFYIPVVDKTSGKCIFSPDDYDQLRRKLSGLERYDAPEFVFASDADLYTPGVAEIASTISEQDQNIAFQRQQIEQDLTKILTRNIPNFQGLKTTPDGDLTPGYIELIDTGSTGRGTSIPGDKIDFDFIMRLDAATYNNPEKFRIFEDTLRRSLQAESDNSNYNGLRLKGVTIADLDELLDLDISFVQRTNHMEFSTEQAVHDRLAAIKAQSPEKYQAVVANIILGKQILKNAKVYKPKHSSDTFNAEEKGGLGGIGVENWILQNGGSFKAAAEDFLAAATQSEYSFQKFCEIYPIWDAGQNHFTIRDNENRGEQQNSHQSITYDNFVTRNMDAGGFSRMVTTLQNYLASIT